MKKYIYKLLLISLITVIVASCKKYIESVPIEQQTIDFIFDTRDSAGVNANLFLYDIYTHIPNISNRVDGDFLASATDDAVSSNSAGSSVQKMATAAYTSATAFDNQWVNYYTAIRQTNIFINNIDKVPLKGKLANGIPFNRVWKAEIRFLRALFYFELVERYGGVPLLGDKVYQLGDDLRLPRNSYADCVQFIVSECDAVKDSLRPDPALSSVYERPTKGAALALKARTLLYAASPLFNGGNVDPGNALTGYSDYSADRWKEAADAAKAIIDLNVFGLVPNFKDVFLIQVNKEKIFSRSVGNTFRTETENGPVGYSSAPGNGRTSPTQELVDAFGMANGKAITDAGSGYNPDTPYKARDPRFNATILFNGAQWLGRPLETYEGGSDKPGGTKQQTLTGYYYKKYFGNFETAVKYSNHPHDDILFRYAEVLLNYAEAGNEYLSAPDQEVYNSVEAIRQRAGLNPYQLDAGLSKEAMRSIIHNERRKELAFEGHRYWDVRRWKDAEVEFNKTLHGELIYKEGSGKLTYQRYPVEKMVFIAPKMYLAPIPYSEVVKNPKMIQNPGW